MPTVGWIREGALDRFLEGRPLPTVQAAQFQCPFCNVELPSPEERARHLAEAHTLERPGLFIRGRPASVHERIRTPLNPAEIVVVGCDQIHVDAGRGGRICSTKYIVQIFTRARRGRYKLELVRRRAGDGAVSSASHMIEFDVPRDSDLENVDRKFVDLLARSDLSMADIERFVKACGRTTASRYVDALCSYAVGILAKEQDPGSGISLAFERFLEKLRTAFEGLADIKRPLAATIRAAIRLGLNDFGDPEPDLGPRSSIGTTYRFFAAIAVGGAIDPADTFSSEGEPICPIDGVTADLTRLVLSRSRTLPEPRYRDLMRRAEATEIAPSDRAKYAVLLAQAAMTRSDFAVAQRTLQQIAHDAAFGQWAETKLGELGQSGR